MGIKEYNSEWFLISEYVCVLFKEAAGFVAWMIAGDRGKDESKQPREKSQCCDSIWSLVRTDTADNVILLEQKQRSAAVAGLVKTK